MRLDWVLFGMELGVDRTTAPFLALTLVLWALAALFAWDYVRERRGLFAAFFAATFAGNLGLVLARDAASFYLFFSLMTFAAYGLVVHERDAAALRAGRVYIVLAVLGEAMLLAGLLLAAQGSESLALADVRAAAAASSSRELITALILGGFGVKAGLFGLHVWLPLAHPVAPAPASAVLSGAMIKAGLLGWIQFLPLTEAPLPAWGAALAAAGLLAAFYGAALGVVQKEPKTVLAYSSVSQMGFMTAGVGAALADVSIAPAAIAAAAYYALHHGLAKGALFLGAGVAPRRALFLLLVLPALVLSGLPFTSGAAAKHALKDVLDAWPFLGPLLSLAAAGTTLLMARFLLLMLRSEPGEHGPRALAAWIACTLASLGAVLLAPFAAPQWSDLWPAALGIAIAAVFLYRPMRLVRIAPGDLLIPLETAGVALARWMQDTTVRIGREARRDFGVAVALWRRIVGALAGASSDGERRLRAAGSAALLIVLALVFAAELL